MGRYVRAVLRDFAARPDLAVTLLVRDMPAAGAYRELIAAEIAPLSAARTGRFAAVWYPWNGIRFPAAAPAIVSINDDFAFAYPARSRIARWREQRPIRAAVERAAHIITISDWARRTLIERFALAAERISVVPLAPDPAFTPGDAASAYSEPFVLVVGTRDARKNIAFLIDVFARAFPNRDVRLVLVGELDADLRRRTQAANLLFTELAGLDDAELRRLYRSAAAVAVPSLAEGFGLVAAEAQGCGAAVIAANASALPEAVGAAGMLVDPRDAGAWTAGLRAIVRDAALNAYYRKQAVARWPPQLRHRTADAVRSIIERCIDDCA